MRRIVSGVSMAALLVALALLSNALITSGNQPTIQSNITELENTSSTAKTTLTVVGYGSVKFGPDTVSLSFTMISQDISAEKALTKCSEKTTAVINLLKSLGISEEDMETGYVNVYPLYDWEAKPPKIISYEAQYNLGVTVRDISLAGKAIDEAIKAGADRLDGITFTLSNGKQNELKLEAIKAAVQDAREKAETVAKTLGLKIVNIESITLSSIETPAPIPVYKETVGSTVPILPSQGEVTATVTIIYSLGT